MENCKIKKTPVAVGTDLFSSDGKAFGDKGLFLSILGRLIYLSVKGRYDILYFFSRLCKRMSNPLESDFVIIKHILRYLKYTENYKLFYRPTDDNKLIIYSDADFGNDISTSRSISGTCTFLYNCVISYSSKQQKSPSTSTTQAEINSICDIFYELTYINELIREIDTNERLDKYVLNDNQSAIASVRTLGDFSRNKHYVSKINYIRNQLNESNINLNYIESKLNCADIFTKATNSNRMKQILQIMNIKDEI